MTFHHMHSKEFLVGAAVGSLLGGVAALLAAPKSGSELRQDMGEAYSDLSDKASRVARKGKSFAKDAGCRTCDWADRAKSALGLNKEEWIEEENEDALKDLLIGGLAGSLLGAVAGLLLAPKSGSDLREDIREGYEEISEKAHDFMDDMAKKGKSLTKNARSKSNKWLNLAQQIVEELSEEVDEKKEELQEGAHRLVGRDNRVHDFMELLSLGNRLWKTLKSKR